MLRAADVVPPMVLPDAPFMLTPAVPARFTVPVTSVPM
jgi:hypothetical protein